VHAAHNDLTLRRWGGGCVAAPPAPQGVSWNLTATPTDFFPGRLAAPRFVQYGRNYDGAPADWVYVYFPGTQGDAAFFGASSPPATCPRAWHGIEPSVATENNDEMLLARVDKHKLLDRSAYQFFNGLQLDGSTSWTTDSTIARAVWTFPLMTSVQQANYHPSLKRYSERALCRPARTASRGPPPRGGWLS
jgi:hypothetical protein